VLMLQREVAERLMARPGAMSYLAVQTQLLARPRLVGVSEVILGLQSLSNRLQWPSDHPLLLV